MLINHSLHLGLHLVACYNYQASTKFKEELPHVKHLFSHKVDKVWDHLPGGGEGGNTLFSNFIMLSVLSNIFTPVLVSHNLATCPFLSW